MARFRKGSDEVIKSRACQACKNNRHTECVAELEAIGMVDVEDFYSVGSCDCFEHNIEKHG